MTSSSMAGPTEANDAGLQFSMAPMVSHLKTPSPSTPVNDTPPATRGHFSAGDASRTSRLLFDSHSPQQLESSNQQDNGQASTSAFVSPLGQQVC